MKAYKVFVASKGTNVRTHIELVDDSPMVEKLAEFEPQHFAMLGVCHSADGAFATYEEALEFAHIFHSLRTQQGSDHLERCRALTTVKEP